MKRLAVRRSGLLSKNLRSLKKTYSTQTIVMIAVVVLAGLLGGVYLLAASHALTPTASFEPENGTRTTGATLVADTNASNGKAVKFSASQPPPTGTYTMCTSKGDDTHDGYPNWDAVRVYTFGTADAPIAAGAKIIALTDGAISPTGGQSSADATDTKLAAFFQKHPNIEVHWGVDNELDRDITSSNAADYVNTMKLMRPVIDKYQSQGRKISLWADLTANNIKSNPAVENLIKPSAQYLDGIAVSMYPPGTDMSDFPSFLDPVFALVKQWGVNRIAMWEGGSKVEPDTSVTSIALTDVNGTKTTYHVSSYKQLRPLWTAYYAKYVYDSGVKNNIPVEEMCWWDGDTPGRETFFYHDPTGTDPRTVEVWRDWQAWIGKAE